MIKKYESRIAELAKLREYVGDNGKFSNMEINNNILCDNKKFGKLQRMLKVYMIEEIVKGDM